MRMINKHEFIQMVFDKVRGMYTYEAAYWITKAVFESMEEILKDGNKLMIKGYISMYPQFKKERKVSNFGDPCISPEHYVPCIKPGQYLVDACDYYQEHKEEIEDEDNGD